MRRFGAELALGMRLAVTSGRQGWVRLVLTAAGVTLGVIALLLAASVPAALHAQTMREAARADYYPGQDLPQGDTVVVATPSYTWHGHEVRSRLFWPESPGAPIPPGIGAYPEDGRAYVSPALLKALDDPDLRAIVPYEIAGTISDAGLSGPQELAFVATDARVQQWVGDSAHRLAAFGTVPDEPSLWSDKGTLGLVVLATLLLPVLIFVGVAVRFGAEARDRRLAAIRLAGADRRAIRRIGVGESLVPAIPGVLAGWLLFEILRPLTARFQFFDFSFFPSDVRPDALPALLVTAGVFALTAGLTLLALRGVVIEPLGVVRRSAVWRGRLWWRLIPVAAGLALIHPVVTGMQHGAQHHDDQQVMIGVVVLLASLVPLVPYAVPLLARMADDGPPAWQLAIRQLRLNPVASARAMTGIMVGVAGTIALHSLFATASVDASASVDTSASADATTDADATTNADATLSTDATTDADATPSTDTTPSTDATTSTDASSAEQTADTRRGDLGPAQYIVTTGHDFAAAFRAMPEVRSADTLAWYETNIVVGDCSGLAMVAALDRCADGDVFTLGDVPAEVETSAGGRWTVPRTARQAGTIEDGATDAGHPGGLILVTPAAMPAAIKDAGSRLTTYVRTAEDASIAERLQAVAAGVDPMVYVANFVPEREDPWAGPRAVMKTGLAVLLLLMGLGLILDIADRLHERRRLLGVLSAVGARRSTMIWSVLWQSLVPVMVGLVLAVGTGLGIGAVLMRAAEMPISFDAGAVLIPAGTGLALVMVATAAVLIPTIKTFMGTEELRYE